MRTRHVAVATVVVGLLSTFLPVTTASAADGVPAAPRAASTTPPPAATPAGGAVVVRRDTRGRAHYLAPASGRALSDGAAAGSRSATAAARGHLRRFGSVFGVTDAQLTGDGVTSLGHGSSVVRFQQHAGGLPVLGGQLATVVDRSGGLQSLSGETARTVLSSTYAVPAATARATALAATARDAHAAVSDLVADAPQRWLYDPSIFDATAAPGGRASWVVQVTAPGRVDVRELVVVDGRSGAVRLHVNQVEHLNRVVCDNRNRRTDDYSCKRGRYVRTEGGPAAGVLDVKRAFDNVGATASFYARFGVDLTSLIGSDLGDGKKLRSTVRVCPVNDSCPMENASWDGQQMVFGQGFAAGDDVVAHELSHGVTQHTSGLVYWFESGAINESMSDVFGEFVDQTDGVDNSANTTRWLLGEDLPGGPTRSMSNPLAFQQPDQVGGALWAEGADDDGGVHTNSGPGNKAAYLITDGTGGEPNGTFAGLAFPGLGVDTAAALYWTAENLLTPGSDYADLANALSTACLTVGVPQASCDATVKGATSATRMQAPEHVAPTAPRNLVVTGLDGGVRVRWTPPAASGTRPVNSYVLVLTPAIGGERSVILDTAPRDQTFTGVPTGRTFTFGLTAVSAHGNSAVTSRTLQGTRLSLSAPAAAVLGRRLTLRGRLTGTTAGAGQAARVITLRRRLAGKKAFTVLRKTRTSRTGAYSFALKPTRKATYLATFGSGSTVLLGTHSARATVPVRQRVTLSADRATVRRGATVHFTGRVSPPRAGRVQLQRQRGQGRFVTVATARTDGRGRFRLAARARTGVDYHWRVVVGRTASLAAGISAVRAVRVA